MNFSSFNLHIPLTQMNGDENADLYSQSNVVSLTRQNELIKTFSESKIM